MPRKLQLTLALFSLVAALTLPSITRRATAMVQTGSSCATPSFGQGTNYPLPANTSFIITSDFNQDGKPDVAVTDYGHDSVMVLLGNGGGGFGTATSFAAGNYPLRLATGDFNTDNKPDLVTANDANNVSVLLGNGNGSFAAAVNFSTGNTEPGNTVLDVIATDLNEDGKVDLAVTNYFGKVSVLLGNGSGGFGTPTNYPVSGVPNSIAKGDFNQDGKIDLVTANEFGDNVSVLPGTGGGGFGSVTNFNAGIKPTSVAAMDFNSDSKLDLVIVNRDPNSGGVSVLLGNGDGSFAAPVSTSLSNPIKLAVADFNLDGKSDVVVTGSAGAGVLLGNGSGGFVTTTTLSSSIIAVAANDINGDNRPDVLTAPTLAIPAYLTVFLNTCGSPKIEATPTSLDFGTVNTGQTKDLSLTVRNTGSGTLNVNALTSSHSAFSPIAPALPFNVAAGEQQTVTVRFAPTTIGNLSSTLSLASNDPTTPITTVDLTGLGSDPCASVIAPTSQALTTLGGTGSVTVTIASGCAWTATSNTNWLSITSGASGSGNGSVNYSAAANLANTPRNGTLTIAGKTFTVMQAGCVYALSVTSQSFTSAGGTSSLDVTTTSGCAWTATSNADWITITGGSSSNGNGTVNFSVAADPLQYFRTGTLTIAGLNLTVSQGAPLSNWVAQTSGTTNELRSVHFTSESEGWAAGANATLLKTTNGGTNWMTVNTGVDSSRGFNSVRFINRTTGFVGGNKSLVRTLDAGSNWTIATHNIFGSNRLIASIFPVIADEIWLAGGEEGSPANSFFTNYGFNTDGSLTFFEGTFTCCGPDPARDLGNRDLYFLHPGLGWVVGAGGQISIWTGDRFRPSDSQTSGTSEALNGIHMLGSAILNTTIGWIVGNNGTILKTTNGGTDWIAQSSGTAANLRDVAFLDAQRGWAVGDGGVILSTSDAGGTWTQEVSGVTTDLHSVHFVTSSAGFAVGANGTILRRTEVPITASVSAASYRATGLAPEAIAAVFGTELAAATQGATTVPLPTTLAGTTIKVRDSQGAERDAPLFFVSPGQVNYLIPAETSPGLVKVTVTNSAGRFAVGTMQIARVAPGLFAANADGQGVAAAQALRVKADNQQIYEPIARFDSAISKFVAVPIDLGFDTEQVFLVLFGTGFRGRNPQGTVSTKIGGLEVEVIYAGSQGGFVGLDQANVRVPRSLTGRGEVEVELTVDGKVTNTVKVNIK